MFFHQLKQRNAKAFGSAFRAVVNGNKNKKNSPPPEMTRLKRTADKATLNVFNADGLEWDAPISPPSVCADYPQAKYYSLQNNGVPRRRLGSDGTGIAMNTVYTGPLNPDGTAVMRLEHHPSGNRLITFASSLFRAVDLKWSALRSPVGEDSYR